MPYRKPSNPPLSDAARRTIHEATRRRHGVKVRHPESLPRDMSEIRAKQDQLDEVARKGRPRGSPSANDPCPCGSYVRYRDCCGKQKE